MPKFAGTPLSRFTPPRIAAAPMAAAKYVDMYWTFCIRETNMANTPRGNPPGETLTQLGHPVGLPAAPEEAVLEHVANPHPGTLYLIRFTVPEFTSLCPITGQPD